MWEEDEDNNPYASPGAAVDYQRPFTPTSDLSSPQPNESPEIVGRPHELDDVEYDDPRPHHIEPKRGGSYESRVEQILYEHPDAIAITHAGKNSESGGGYIAYTIQTGDLQVRRRYSEFASLRQTLVNLHPTLIIPPIPEKHSMADYAAKPTKAKEDAGIIELRKRMLAVFLNRCRRMPDVLGDGVFWKFLDPNVSWNEVLNTPPVATIPKSILKAPPLDTGNPTVAHSYLPVPSNSAKLKSAGYSMPSGTPGAPSSAPSRETATSTVRFPTSSQNLSEEDLDPYFINFEASSKELELLLQGSMEKSNRRMLAHYSSLAEDLAELGARYNAFSLSEQSPALATAVEKVGQASDNTYIATSQLSSQLSATFAEPMRESAQFAGVVRSVLRYRVLKRVQEEMARDELDKKRALLANLRDQEEQSQRMSATLNSYASPSTPKQTPASPKRTPSSPSPRTPDRGRRDDEVASIDSDFPSSYGDSPRPSANQGLPEGGPSHRKSGSASFLSNKIFGRISHAFQGVVDSDPIKTRQDLIGKTIEQVKNLEQAIVVSHDDVKDASAGVLKDLKRFQGEKEEDLKRYMIAFARCHVEWSKKNLEYWVEAKKEVENIQVDDVPEYEVQTSNE